MLPRLTTQVMFYLVPNTFRKSIFNLHIGKLNLPNQINLRWHSPRTTRFYEWNRIGFGLTNTPATFQRRMEECMGDMHLNECLIFLIHILIFLYLQTYIKTGGHFSETQ